MDGGDQIFFGGGTKGLYHSRILDRMILNDGGGDTAEGRAGNPIGRLVSLDGGDMGAGFF